MSIPGLQRLLVCAFEAGARRFIASSTIILGVVCRIFSHQLIHIYLYDQKFTRSKMETLRRLFNGYISPKTIFQVMSDLHLEVHQQYAYFNIPPKAPYLILAGDIGRLKDHQPYLEFLARQCDQFVKVFLVVAIMSSSARLMS